jgi:2-polyprenyl-6-hydroxyphenyl methylase/3-demethylubiquinone-9 3-methyltransferase
MDIDRLKISYSGSPCFVLKDAVVFKSNSGYTFSKYLDCNNTTKSELPSITSQDLAKYITKQLESNQHRFDWQKRTVKKYVEPQGTFLDVGCGGGIFLQKLKDEGYRVEGLEPEKMRAEFSRERLGVQIYNVPIEGAADAIETRYSGMSLWDVIEHVDFPFQTLQTCHALLKEKGYLFIDTPAKDSFYHRVGELTYKLSFGKLPTFLNIMYSEKPFAHKQIFSTREIAEMLNAAGFDVVELRKIHELSFPYDFYLKQLLKSEVLVKAVSPLVKLLFAVLKIENKMVVVARKH